MKQIFHIAMIDIRMMVRDKVFFFFSIIFPLIFIFIFGNLYKDDGKNPADLQAQLTVLNKDTGPWGNYFIEKLKSPLMKVDVVQEEPKRYNNLLILPPDFSNKLETRKAQELPFLQKESTNMKESMQAEIKIIQAVTRLITEIVLHPDHKTFFQTPNSFKEIIRIKTGFPAQSNQRIPTGFDHVIPGTMVHFILMMVFIYGGMTVMTDRKNGILARMLFSSASVAHLWAAKFLGRVIMGFIQALILIVAGILFFNLNLGNLFLSALNILFFSIAVASCSIYLGSVVNKEDLLIGISILASNFFAALGGCWWPIEVVPETFRTIGMISPAYWAMDAFHKIIFFNAGVGDIMLNIAVLTGFAAVFTYLSITFFKIR